MVRGGPSPRGGNHCRRRLARAVGGGACARQRARLAPPRRPGIDAIQAAARRRGPQSADCLAVLEGQLDYGAEPMAPLDDGSFDAYARRPASTTAITRLQLAPVRRGD